MKDLTMKEFASHGQVLRTSRASRPAASLGPSASPLKLKLLDQVRLEIRLSRGGRGVRSPADML